ncbi:response regulator [Gemmobacter serpentinus]|uniref:response regulator n=1 Tax=Gemmobacter serpentinus TaxID=2652247 RepID=UPI00124E6C1F|nr:response regulator [Gemmobacter serpentinus]
MPDLTPEPPLHLPGPAAPGRVRPGTVMLGAADLPLQGLTLLAVEDSRLASDALRLMCQRSGARLRRAESLATARAHLGCYRPDLVMVDLGLPDGDGCALIADLRLRPNHPPILALSGDPDGQTAAIAAGANAFQAKPVPGLAGFQALILRLLSRPPQFDPASGPVSDPATLPLPDEMALRDDLSYAASMLLGRRGGVHLRYIAGFLAGVAQAAKDEELAQAAQNALRQGDNGHGPLAALLDQRLAQPLGRSLAPDRP